MTLAAASPVKEDLATGCVKTSWHSIFLLPFLYPTLPSDRARSKRGKLTLPPI